jgi:hypothetical protein
MASPHSLAFGAYFATAALALVVACGAGIPKAELDRCSLGVADGNEGYRAGQGTACGIVAKRLAADEKPREAMGYARKACQLEDSAGCNEYLALVRALPSVPPDELMNARLQGEKACDGMVVGAGATDARPALCVRTAELYLDIEPRSAADAGRLYVRACRLGDAASCASAKSLGVDPEAHAAAAPKARALPPPPPRPQPPATPSAAAPPPPPPCHEMRPCVSLELVQRNADEVMGTLANHCDRPVACTWCPSHGDKVDKTGCRTTNVAPGESKSGRDAGLWYQGYNAMAYDCMDAADDRGCLAL